MNFVKFDKYRARIVKRRRPKMQGKHMALAFFRAAV